MVVEVKVVAAEVVEGWVVAEASTEGSNSVEPRIAVAGIRNRADTRNTAEPFDGSACIGCGVGGSQELPLDRYCPSPLVQ